MTRDELERRARGGDEAAQLAFADVLDAESRHTEAIDILATAARNGSAEALGRIGARLLVGDRAPMMPQQAIGLIEDSARGGSASAAALLATLCAAGAYRRQSWSEALDLLQRAAENGSAHARSQLALLAGDRALAVEAEAGDAASRGLWGRLRRSVDVAAHAEPPEGRTLNEEPLIRSFPGFVSPPICDWLMARAAEKLKRAEIYNGAPTTNRVGSARTNSIRGFALHEIDLVQLLLQARMSKASGIPFSHMEAPSVLHYAVGQEFVDHYDFIDPNTQGYQQVIAQYGERTVTFLVYLNDDYEGGETAFPRLGVSHKGMRGEGMFFTNALPSGGPDLRALHAGRPPTHGEKWIVSQFIRSRPFVPGVS